MNTADAIAQEVKQEEKAKSKGRLRIIKDQADRLKAKKAERAEAKALGFQPTETKSERKARLRAEKKPGAPVEVKTDRKSERSTEDVLLEKYPHMVKGSLGYDKNANKATATIKCQSGESEDCDKTREVYTSDLFQIKHCRACLKLIRNKKRNKKLSQLAKKHGSVNKGRKANKKAKKS